MIRNVETSDYPRLMEIWESSVRHTHHFLREDDFRFYREMLPTYFPYVRLYGYQRNGVLTGFMGVAEDSLEMLFVEHEYRGTGMGRALLCHALRELHVRRVDVNEQNTQALGFYEHLGFKVCGRSERDAEGKAYPILHMER